MRGRASRAVVALAAAVVTVGAGAEPLEFHREHVPADRLGDVPLGPDRYLPMPLAEFEAAVARARVAAGLSAEPVPAATTARWRATLDESGTLVGTVSCDVGAEAAGPGRVLALGGLRPRGALRTGDPPREAVVCGGDAGVALAIPEPGTYEFEFACAPEATGPATVRLPLVPALATSIRLELPPGMRPVLSGSAARRALLAADASGAWRIDVGPAVELGITLEPREPPVPAVALWADVSLAGPRATIAATVVPTRPWRAGRLVLTQDPTLRTTEVRAGGDPLEHVTASDGGTLAIIVPRRLEGTRTPLLVRGVAPATGPVWRLPLLEAGSGAWAGGGSVVRVDPAFVVRDAEFTECRAVAPDVAATWPTPDGAADAAGAPGAAVWRVEEQAPGARLEIAVGPREPAFDVARVTTVDIGPGGVRGRVACDVRVVGGVAHEITGRVAPGWIIDSVDAVDWSAAADEDADVAATMPAPVDRAVDWRVVPSPVGDALRVGLAFGADGRRGVGLRITGHRAGLAPGAAFTTADIDMVQFEGESADNAVVDLRTNADAFVEVEGRPAGWFEVEDRLEPLVEEGAPRGRIRGGARAAAVEARVVRRRPPLDVETEVRLEARDDVLVETFTFDCRAATGVDSLVVDFAHPGGAGLAWRVESPQGVGVTALPLDRAEGGLASRSAAVADSWLVDLGAAVAGPVRIRATRSVPFTAAVPVPLAWVEGATEPGGRVVVGAPAGTRPRIVNRRLRELPADPASVAGTTEFAYGAPLPGDAAEIVRVAAGADARAWAWRETVSCWCDESGATESESRFDVENDGRESLALSLAPGRRLESVLVDGVTPPGVEFGPAGADWRIPLPPGRRRLEIVVRTVAGGTPGRGAWRIDPVGCRLDLPVLDRDVRLLLPPGLVLGTVMPELDPSARLPWTARLFGIGGLPPATAAPTGFRSTTLAGVHDRGAGVHDRGAAVLVVRRATLAGVAILAGVVTGIVAFLRTGRNRRPAWLFAAVPALAALWLPAAFVPVARAAWWGALVGLAWAFGRGAAWPAWWRWRIGRAAAAAACVAAAVMLPRVAADETGPRVFVTPGADGGTALVPEPLFRALAAAARPESAAIRVCECRIVARRSDGGSVWDVSLDVDADAGGRLVLDAGPGARWLPSRGAAAGVEVMASGREVRLAAGVAGRRTVELVVAPAVERRGTIETESASIPVAPDAVLEVIDEDAVAGAVACERAAGAGPFVRAAPTAGGGHAAFDVAAADRVRLVRPVDPRDRLAAGPRDAETTNDVAWDGRGGRVQATIDVDAGPDLLRAFVVRTDPRLENVTVPDGEAAPPRLVPLGDGRVRVELPEALRGRLRVRLTARLPVADPVGVFDVPGIWMDGLPAEVRTIRFAANDDLDATLDPPSVVGLTAADAATRQPTRVTVRRRRPQIRATQSLAVAFAPGGIDLAFEAQIDAAAAALAKIPIDVPVGCVVERVALLVDDPGNLDAREAVDVAWTRTAADRVLLVVQRPRPGRFRLEVAGRLARRPASTARLPVIRARLATATPLVVSWTAASPLVVTVAGAGQPGRPDIVEIPEGTTDPDYALSTAPEPMPVPPAPVAVDDDASRVERAEVRVAFDARGRVHGLVRFDVVGAPPVVRLRLPPGLRLFDVLVDGRVVAAEPREADAWDVPLGTAPWPRTILAVFAGDVGRGVGDGRPLSLVAPLVEGLPTPDVLWSLRPPPGHVLEVSPPARSLNAAEIAAAHDSARTRIAAACDRAVAAATGPERDRLEAFAALRREDGGPEAEQSWWRAADHVEADPAAVVTVATTDPIVIRSIPAADATLPARAAVTALALVGFAGVAWSGAARRRRRAARPIAA